MEAGFGLEMEAGFGLEMKAGSGVENVHGKPESVKPPWAGELIPCNEDIESGSLSEPLESALATWLRNGGMSPASDSLLGTTYSNRMRYKTDDRSRSFNRGQYTHASHEKSTNDLTRFQILGFPVC